MHSHLTGLHIFLRPVCLSDAEVIVRLRRANSEKNDFLTPMSEDLGEQERWLAAYAQRHAADVEYYFMICQNESGKPCGTIRLYDFQGDSFSWGSWLVESGSPRSAALQSMLLVNKFAFELLGFKQSHFQVKRENRSVVDFHLNCGAEIVREDATQLHFRFTRSAWDVTKSRYRKFMPDDSPSEFSL